MSEGRLYGIVAEFKHGEILVDLAKQARDKGYTQLDGLSPFPVEGLAEALGSHGTSVPAIALAGGLVGGLGGYFMLYISSVVFYPINVAGRPFHSWPMFIPITFELTILFSGLFAAFGMLALNGLPRPHHPLFGLPQFSQVTDDRFFFCIEATDPIFDSDKAKEFLQGFNPEGVYLVHHER